MAVKIRLKRVGAKKNPHYRVVIADARAPRDGRFIEEIGSYNPQTQPSTIKIKMDRAEYWLSQGAQPTETVRSLLKKAGQNGTAQAEEVQAEVSTEVSAETSDSVEACSLASSTEEQAQTEESEK